MFKKHIVLQCDCRSVCPAATGFYGMYK